MKFRVMLHSKHTKSWYTVERQLSFLWFKFWFVLSENYAAMRFNDESKAVQYVKAAHAPEIVKEVNTFIL